MEHFPKGGGCLLVSNHLSYADPVFIGAAFSRKIRYLAYSGLAKSRIMRFVFRLTETLTVSPEKSLQSIRESVKRLETGMPLCIFAEGGISRIGMVLPFMRGPIVLGKRAGVPVLPVHLDGVWGSIFSMDKGRFFKKIPLSLPYHVTVRVGMPLNSKEIDEDNCRNAVMELGRQSFADRVRTKLKIQNFLKGQIFEQGKGVFWMDDGVEVTRSEFLKMVKGNDMPVPRNLIGWVEEVRDVISGESTNTERHLSNWMRMQETHYWDYENIIVEDETHEWIKQWLPWAGLLWGRTIEKRGSTYLLKSIDSTFSKPELKLSGLATEKNGIISINAFSKEPTLLDQSDINQILYKEKTWGRILVGFGFRQQGDDYFIKGVRSEEKIPSAGVDRDGFLIPSKDF
jgi:1-acyl-sn-glycerol-3-phosphate acyltransferase